MAAMGARVCLIAAVFALAGAVSAQPYHGAHDANGYTQRNHPQASLGMIGVGAPAVEYEDVAGQRQQAPNDDPPEGRTPLEGTEGTFLHLSSGWWLVIVAFVTGAVVAWQAYETRRAVNAENRALAAQTDKDRPRIRLVPELFRISIGTPCGVAYAILNHGPTNASVTSLGARLDVSDARHDRLPISMERYQLEVVPNGRYNGATHGFGVLSLMPAHVLDSEAAEGIRGASLFVHFRAAVRYRSVFGTEYISEAHLVWTLGRSDAQGVAASDRWEPEGSEGNQQDAEQKSARRRWYRWPLRHGKLHPFR